MTEMKWLESADILKLRSTSKNRWDVIVQQEVGDWRPILINASYDEAADKIEDYCSGDPRNLYTFIEMVPHKANLAVFDPLGVGSGIHCLMVNVNGKLVSEFGGDTLEDLKAKARVSPEAVVCPLEEALDKAEALVRERLCGSPQRLSYEQWAAWMVMLECLPPNRWDTLGDAEAFMVPEPVSGTIYTYGVRINKDYFSINEDAGKSLAGVIALCKAVL